MPGNAAVFTKAGGYVVPEEMLSKTLEALNKAKGLKMKREGGIYNFKLWIPRPPVNIKSNNRFTPLQEVAEEDMDFRWPGADAM